MLLIEVGYDPIAGWRGVQVPGDRVRARPVSERLRAGVDRGANGVARVEPGSPHLGEVPAGTEIAGTHFRVRLKAAGCQDHGIGFEFFFTVVSP